MKTHSLLSKKEARNFGALLTPATVQRMTLKPSIRKPTVVAIALGALFLASAVRAEDKKVNLEAIPKPEFWHSEC
jgi:hypothetical protein